MTGFDGGPDERTIEAFQREMQKATSVAEGFGRTMTKAFDGAIVRGRDFGDVLRSLALQLSSMAIGASAETGRGGVRKTVRAISRRLARGNRSRAAVRLWRRDCDTLVIFRSAQWQASSTPRRCYRSQAAAVCARATRRGRSQLRSTSRHRTRRASAVPRPTCLERSRAPSRAASGICEMLRSPKGRVCLCLA